MKGQRSDQPLLTRTVEGLLIISKKSIRLLHRCLSVVIGRVVRQLRQRTAQPSAVRGYDHGHRFAGVPRCATTVWEVEKTRHALSGSDTDSADL